MTNWRVVINGDFVTSVVRSSLLHRAANGVSSFSAVLALPVVTTATIEVAQRDWIDVVTPEGRVEFRGRVASMTKDGRNLQVACEDHLAPVRDRQMDANYIGTTQVGVTAAITSLTLDNRLNGWDNASLSSFTAKQIGGLEALIRLHQLSPSGQGQHVFYHDPIGNKVRIELIGGAGDARYLALGHGLRSIPPWLDTTAEIVNSVVAGRDGTAGAASDAGSISLYGTRGMSINAPDFPVDQLQSLASSVVQQRASPRLRLQVECRWKDIVPDADSPLNQRYAISDPSRNFPSDAVKLASNSSATVANSYTYSLLKTLTVGTIVKPSTRIAIDWNNVQTSSLSVRLNSTTAYDGTELMSSADDTAGDWLRLTADVERELRPGDTIKVWATGHASVRNLQLCYDAGQVTLPLIAYDVEWPGSKVTALFDQAVIAQLAATADLEQRVNILENYQPAGGAADDEFTYTEAGGVATITGYTGIGGAIEIPATIDGYPVVAISQLYWNSPNLPFVTSVVIGQGVQTIGDYAFNGATALVGVTVPNSVTSIGDGAFESCVKLFMVNLPSSVATVGARAFWNCSSLRYLNMAGVRTIGNQAFENCTALLELWLPDTLTYLGHYAFGHCSALTTVTFMGGSFLIDTWCFQHCSWLVTINFEGMDMGTATANANWLSQVPYNYLQAHAHAGSNWPTQGQVFPSGYPRGDSGVQMGSNL